MGVVRISKYKVRKCVVSDQSSAGFLFKFVPVEMASLPDTSKAYRNMTQDFEAFRQRVLFKPFQRDLSGQSWCQYLDVTDSCQWAVASGIWCFAPKHNGHLQLRERLQQCPDALTFVDLPDGFIADAFCDLHIVSAQIYRAGLDATSKEPVLQKELLVSFQEEEQEKEHKEERDTVQFRVADRPDNSQAAHLGREASGADQDELHPLSSPERKVSERERMARDTWEKDGFLGMSVAEHEAALVRKLFDPLKLGNTQRTGSNNGHVYLFWDPTLKLVKVGCSKTAVQRWVNLRRDCGIDNLVLYYDGGGQFMGYQHVEKIVQLYLQPHRVQYKCPCKPHGVKHQEWFNVSKEDAKEVIDLWKDFLISEVPYGELQTGKMHCLRDAWVKQLNDRVHPDSTASHYDLAERLGRWRKLLRLPGLKNVQDGATVSCPQPISESFKEASPTPERPRTVTDIKESLQSQPNVEGQESLDPVANHSVQPASKTKTSSANPPISHDLPDKVHISSANKTKNGLAGNSAFTFRCAIGAKQGSDSALEETKSAVAQTNHSDPARQDSDNISKNTKSASVQTNHADHIALEETKSAVAQTNHSDPARQDSDNSSKNTKSASVQTDHADHIAYLYDVFKSMQRNETHGPSAESKTALTPTVRDPASFKWPLICTLILMSCSSHIPIGLSLAILILILGSSWQDGIVDQLL